MTTPITADDVVDAAWRLLDEGGFDALSVRRVADRLGVSRQVVYTHFGGMHGLLDALHERSSRELSGRVAALELPAGSSDHLSAAAGAYLAMARAHPYPYQLMFERPVVDYTPSSSARAVGLASFGHIVASADGWLHGRPTSSPADPQSWHPGATELARVLWTAAHGFAVLERAGYATTAETDRLVDTTVTSVLAGWRVTSVSTAPFPPR